MVSKQEKTNYWQIRRPNFAIAMLAVATVYMVFINIFQIKKSSLYKTKIKKRHQCLYVKSEVAQVWLIKANYDYKLKEIYMFVCSRTIISCICTILI